MLRDITIGQYYPVESKIHRLDPRMKIIAVILYLISLFLFQNFAGYAVVTVFLGVVIVYSHVPLGYITKGLKPILFLLLFTACFHVFFTQAGDVLFVDEIHRLSRQVEEILYPALEDCVLDIMIGKGPSAQSIRVDLNRFTLIGATTRAGQLTGPLRDRFGVIMRLEMYTPEELCDIVMRSSVILSIPCDRSGAMEIAKRSRGTPRIANRLLKRVRDIAQVEFRGDITEEVARAALARFEIDELGLDDFDRKMLTTIITNYSGGPVGLDTLAAAVGEEAVTIEDVYEPYLMQIGFLTRTARGRCVTALAYDHLGIRRSENAAQQSIF